MSRESTHESPSLPPEDQCSILMASLLFALKNPVHPNIAADKPTLLREDLVEQLDAQTKE